MRAAGPWPVSIFRGRPWPQPGEPLWLDEDRRWALAVEYDQAVRMPCGCYPDDSGGIENEFMFTAVPRVCHRHRAVGEATAQREKSPTDSIHGVWFEVTKKDQEV